MYKHRNNFYPLEVVVYFPLSCFFGHVKGTWSYQLSILAVLEHQPSGPSDEVSCSGTQRMKYGDRFTHPFVNLWSSALQTDKSKSFPVQSQKAVTGYFTVTSFCTAEYVHSFSPVLFVRVLA